MLRRILTRGLVTPPSTCLGLTRRSLTAKAQRVTSSDTNSPYNAPWSSEELDNVYENLMNPQPSLDQVVSSFKPRSFDDSQNHSESLSQRFSNLSPELLNHTADMEELSGPLPKPQVFPSLLTLNSYLKACLRARAVDYAEEAMALAQKNGSVTPDLWSWNTFLEIQLKDLSSGPSSSKTSLSTLLTSLKTMQQAGHSPDLYTHHILIRAYIASNRLEDAFRVYEHLKASGHQPDLLIYTSLTKGCALQGDFARAWSVFDHMRFHGAQPDEVMYSLMIHVCSKNDEVERAMNLLEEMTGAGLKPTEVTYTSLIDACSRRDEYYQETFLLLKEMMDRGFSPNAYTYSALIQAASKVHDLSRARHLALCMVEAWKEGDVTLRPNLFIYSSLIRAYATAKVPGSPPHPGKTMKKDKEIKDLVAKMDPTSPASFPLSSTSPTPTSLAEVIDEAKSLFHYALASYPKGSPKRTGDVARIIQSYLSLYTYRGLGRAALTEWEDLRETMGLQRPGDLNNAWIYHTLLQAADTAKDIPKAWAIWDDFQDWWRTQDHQSSSPSPISRAALQKRQCRTPALRYDAYTIMVKALARAHELPRAVLLVQEASRWVASLPISKEKPRFQLRDFFLLYTRCVEAEDHASLLALLEACPPPELGPLERVERRQRRRWGIKSKGSAALEMTPYQWKKRIRELKDRLEH